MSKEENLFRPAGLEKIRHSLAHLLAMAIQGKHPDIKFGIGPTIENGFYYDFEFSGHTPSPECLPKLEKIIRKLIQQNIKFEQEEINTDEAKKKFTGQPYKLELIEELEKAGEKISIYKSGKFIDLCVGPHVKQAGEIDSGAFKLTKIAGAYWKGSEKNKMLTRIYGIAFETKKELDDYLEMLEEAEKRDHRKIGKELDLFSFHNEGPGFPFWHPKGVILYQEIENFIREENQKREYKEIKTPIILSKELWLKSGHWEKFKEDMYFIEIDEQEFAIKPMNCPGGMLIYNENIHSYRELPIRLSEFGLVHRHELSGVLHGLFRVRTFVQDDAHSFCTPEQLNNEIIQMVDYATDIYKTFGFKEYEIFIATRPEKYIGEKSAWEKATKALKNSLEKQELNYKIKEGEGAFYGPKIEFNIKDTIGRDWQLGTIQVDFSMPQRLGAIYIDKNSKKQNPIMVHRAILGSLERFIGILIEHYAGAFPVWLSPVQAVIIPIGEKFNGYGKKILEELKEAGVRAEIDASNDTLGKRIRNAELQKTPFVLVVGEKEENAGSVAVRSRENGDKGAIKLDQFISQIKNKISEKK